MTVREKLEEYLIDAGETDVIFFDGFDEAIIGLGRQQYRGPYVIYNREKCIEILMEEGMEYEEAEEYFQFNTEGCWVGDYTPVIVSMISVFDPYLDMMRV